MTKGLDFLYLLPRVYLGYIGLKGTSLLTVHGWYIVYIGLKGTSILTVHGWHNSNEIKWPWVKIPALEKNTEYKKSLSRDNL